MTWTNSFYTYILPTSMFRAPLRQLSTAARSSLKIGLIPADGVGREVIPVREFGSTGDVWILMTGRPQKLPLKR